MICEYLWEQIPSTVAPRFVGELPSQAEEGVALSPGEGEENIYYFSQEDTLRKPYVTCYIRTREYTKGEQFSSQVVEALDKFHDDDWILSCTLVGTPTYLGRNEDKLHEFQVVFKIIVKE